MKKFIVFFAGLIILAGVLFFVDEYLPAMIAEKLPKTDKVLVKKSERKLFLLKNNKVIKSYNISLGKHPLGHKKKEGDSRTPEGNYLLDYRNPESDYHLSIHISYPDSMDILSASVYGFAPGGDIMIHGKPNNYGWIPFYFENADWTEGCIAVGNSDIEEIWNSVAGGTPIEIVP